MRLRETGSFHGEFSSADASSLTEANGRFALYLGGQAAAYTLQSDDHVVITEIIISTITALTLTVYDGADATVAAGEKIAHVILAANSQPVIIKLSTPRVCQRGIYPKVDTSASGQVDVTINGYISGPGPR